MRTETDTDRLRETRHRKTKIVSNPEFFISQS